MRRFNVARPVPTRVKSLRESSFSSFPVAANSQLIGPAQPAMRAPNGVEHDGPARKCGVAAARRMSPVREGTGSPTKALPFFACRHEAKGLFYRLRVLLLLFALLLSALPAAAKSWRVADFRDVIMIGGDGSSLVSERITLVFIGDWHGIHRFIP